MKATFYILWYLNNLWSEWYSTYTIYYYEIHDILHAQYYEVHDILHIQYDEISAWYFILQYDGISACYFKLQ